MFPERLRGMFGIAVWDQKRQRGVIARDRLGIKPLYYADCGDTLVFASELKSLLASGLVPTELDYEAIDAYLTLGFFPAPATPLAAVKKLEPGCLLVIENGPRRGAALLELPAADARARRQRRGVERAAAREARGVRPDAADERRPARRDAQRRARLEPDRRADGADDGSPGADLRSRVLRGRRGERARRRAVRGRDARRRPPRAGALVRAGDDRRSTDLVWHLDEPLADLSSLGFIALSELAAQHVTVALSGQGADELLGGYRKHRAASLAGTWQRMPAPLRQAMLCGGARTARRACAGRSTRSQRPDPAERLLAMSGALDARAAQRRSCAGRSPSSTATRRSARSRTASAIFPTTPLPAALYLDGQLGLVGRHAPLLRPGVDGALARGARSLPRPRARRALRGDAGRAEGAPPGDEARAPPRSARPRAGPDHRQAEDRLLQLAPSTTGSAPRRAARSATTCSAPNPRYAEMLDRGAVERLVKSHADAERRGQRLRAALDPDARGLALGVPAARARPATPARERIVA